MAFHVIHHDDIKDLPNTMESGYSELYHTYEFTIVHLNYEWSWVRFHTFYVLQWNQLSNNMLKLDLHRI